MKGFTKIPNWLLYSYNRLTNAEFRVLMCIYRLTAGFQRNKYKISYSKLTEMSGVKSIWKIMQSLKRKGYICFESERGKASVITILKPATSVTQFENQPTTSDAHTMNLSNTHHVHNVNGSQRAKESIKETIKEKGLFFVFKEKYPAFKFDDEATVLQAFDSLPYGEQQEVAGSMEFAIEFWKRSDNKYIPKASDYILKRRFEHKDIRKPYENKLRRKKEMIERQKYYRDAEENAATDAEVREIIDEAISQLK